MKKFLSLLLAMIMSLSLVTISAGATEYKDLTDKDELGPQYQEAVAVLNKIGVITGYDDGSFRPDVKLTRGAAAKIIVSLLIGPEAATNLPNNYAPYPDVPTGHTFAGVISYCKTAGIISGYGDGTFKPANDLTGYAFAKMLLGALGYDATIEGFVDTGWTMNVLSVGQYASLFDRLDFHGSEAVTRKDAALMALNTLKSTVVEYNNPQTITVTGTDTNVVVNGGQVRSYKTSNQDYARNILPQRRDINNSTTSRADYNTVEFAEEHFVDLRLPHDKYQPIEDNYGRPCAEWSYRKLSIGKFPLVPDFEYTTQVIHDVDTVTPASKVRALELNGYNTDDATLYVNGVAVDNDFEVAEIADYTDNGTLVQVYVDNNGADSITHVVVVKSQLMTVKRIGSDYVSLELYKDGKGSDGKEGNSYSGKVSDPKINKIYGFNQIPIDVKINNVETGDDYFEFLSGLKAGDFVVVEPVSADGSATSWDVGHVYAPETVKGALNGVPTRYGDTTHDYSALSVDVGGTTYNVSLWNKDLFDIDPDVVRVTKKDVTLTMDRYGNAMLAQDVGDVSGWLIVGNYRQSIVNGILVTFANGWDLSGNEVSLNIGARAGVSNWINSNDDVWDQNALPRIGSLVHYTNDTSSNTGEWELSQNNQYGTNDWGVYNVFNTNKATGEKYSIRANSSAITVENSDKDDTQGHPIAVREASYDDTATMLMADGIKFIYVTSDDSGELDTIEIKTSRTAVDNEELTAKAIANGNGHYRAQAAVEWKKDDQKVNSNASVKAIVIKQDNSDATYKNLMYVVDYEGSAMRDANGQMVQGYKVAMLDANGKVVITTVYGYRTSLQVGDFARFTKSTHDDHPDDFYTLRHYNGPAIGKGAAIIKDYVASFKGANKNLMTIKNTGAVKFNMAATYAEDRNVYTELSGAGENNNNTFADNMLNLRGAQWVDLSNYKYDIDDADDLKKAMTNDDGSKNDIQVTLLFNDDKTSDNFRSVYMIIINSIKKGTGTTDTTTTGDVRLASAMSGMATGVTGKLTRYPGVASGTPDTAIENVSLKAPSWVDIAMDDGEDSTNTKALASVKFTVYTKDGVKYTPESTEQVSNFTWDADTKSFKQTGTINLYTPEGGYVEISSVKWTRVVVEYTSGVSFTGTPTATLPVAAAGGPVTFTLNSNRYKGTADWSISGVVVPSATDTTGKTAAAGDASNIGSWQALGNGPVKVAITGLQAADTVTYVLKVDSKDAIHASAGTVTTTADPTGLGVAGTVLTFKAVDPTGVSATANVTQNFTSIKEFNLTVEGTTIPVGNSAIKLTYTLGGAEKTVTVKGGETVALGSVNLKTGDDTLKLTKVEGVATAAIKTAVWDSANRQVVVTFDSPVKSIALATSSSGTAEVGAITPVNAVNGASDTWNIKIDKQYGNFTLGLVNVKDANDAVVPNLTANVTCADTDPTTGKFKPGVGSGISITDGDGGASGAVSVVYKDHDGNVFTPGSSYISKTATYTIEITVTTAPTVVTGGAANNGMTITTASGETATVTLDGNAYTAATGTADALVVGSKFVVTVTPDSTNSANIPTIMIKQAKTA